MMIPLASFPNPLPNFSFLLCVTPTHDSLSASIFLLVALHIFFKLTKMSSNSSSTYSESHFLSQFSSSNFPHSTDVFTLSPNHESCSFSTPIRSTFFHQS
ncbi:hypothetical protein Hanom_Chr11g00990831 [Helianthus anomalus]